MEFRRYFSLLLACMALLAAPVNARPLPDFADLVEKVGPAVVNISTTQKVTRARRIPEIFRHFGPPGGGGGQPATSLGSGFIISADGYVLTNAHVVKGADEVFVRLTDRREFNAKVIGSDERSDVALLKVDAKNLPVAKIGDADKLRVGQWVLAIGSPFGFEQTVTAGIVSAKARSVGRGQYVPFLQTDVAINPGNSGGPLFDTAGNVVGINSMIYSRSGGYQGVSFSIPIGLATDIAEQLKAGKNVKRGFLGVSLQPVNRRLAKAYGLTRPQGAAIVKVSPDGPAAKGGIQVGDVILEFNGQDVPTAASLPAMVGIAPVGSTVSVVVWRDGKRENLNVVLGELNDANLAALGSGRTSNQVLNAFGLTLTELTAEEKTAMKRKDSGLIVRDVADGAAEQAGVRKGDIVLMLGGHKLASVQQARQVIADLDGRGFVRLLIERKGNPMFLAIDLSGE